MDDAHPKGSRTARLGRITDRILDTYAAIEAGAAADRALSKTFQNARDLGASERAEVRDVVYSLVRQKRRLDDLLHRAAKSKKKSLDLLEPPLMNRLRLLAWLAEEGADLEALAQQDPYALKRIPGLFERLLSGRLAKVVRSEQQELAIELSLPDWFVSRLEEAFGLERTRAIGIALAHRAPITLRVNRLSGSRDDILERIEQEHGINCTPTLLSPDGLILSQPADVSSWPLFRDGALEVQDEGSQLCALATGVKEGETVLDACAGAGGKTLALAAMMSGRGRLVALDNDKSKIKELRRRARRAKIENVETIIGDLEHLPAKLQNTFDCVLLDAPCTGSGVLRRSPDAVWRMAEKDVDQHAARQQRFLTSAVTALKPGGRLVFATCSVFYEESEAVIDAPDALAEGSRLVRQSLATTWGDELSERLAATHHARIGPGPTDSGPDGFYVALVVRGPPEQRSSK